MTTTTSAAVWDSVFTHQAWGQYPPEHVIRFVARSFYSKPDRTGVRLLDLGCGPGANTWFMAREGFSVSALDVSPVAIGQLRQRLLAEELSAELKVGDMATLPWPDGEFDAVIDNVAMYCNPFSVCRKVVSEVRRVLKPGGRFCSASFTDRSWGYGLGRTVEPGGFVDIDDGPLKGKGFSLLMGRAQIDELYQPFAHRSVERVSWTLNYERNQVEMWVVTCQKE